MNRLLAKSYPGSSRGAEPPPYALLTVHSRDVAAACRTLADMFGETALAAAGLPTSDAARFSRALRACGWMQDSGKSNEHFLDLVSADSTRSQLIRHETLSALLFTRTPLREWIAALGDDGLNAVWAAAGHHRKFSMKTIPRLDCADMRVYTSHPDFRALLSDMGDDLELACLPAFERDLTVGSVGSDVIASRALQELKLDFIEEAERRDSAEVRRFLALVKAFGIAADVAASAIPRNASQEYSVRAIVRDSLLAGRLTPNEVQTLLQAWAKNRGLGSGCAPRPFQTAVADSTSTLTLAVAGCGSGKSLAAYLWTEAWANRYAEDGRADFRLFFCLPTTGTTTEHYKDYALESGVPALLAHSRAAVDLELMPTPADSEEGDARRTEALKIEALRLWATPVIVATSDTVLGLMANTLRALCASPAILSGGIVFDEIHAFDNAMFGHLLAFIKNFPNIPVLLMTASLQPSRLQAIRDVRPDLEIVPGPPELEELPRYTPARIADRDTAEDDVARVLSQGGKVLWVTNRVDDANRIYRRYSEKYPDLFVEVYHSRFRYIDRSHRHRTVIDAFKGDQPALLVATQVAEMSLDLSADLLVTDLAPIPALIQRLGRLNRRATADSPGTPKPALIVPVAPGAERPYAREDLDVADHWLDALVALGRPVSQRELATAADRFQHVVAYDIAQAERDAVFFSGLWATEVRPVRDDGYTVSVILERDWRSLRTRNEPPTSKWLREHEVSIPIKDRVFGWTEHAAYLPVAPEVDVSYSWDDMTKRGTGAEWRRN